MTLPPDDSLETGAWVVVTPFLALPRAEFQFRTSRSGGPGGQHVNKVETRVELLFDLMNSPSIPDDLRPRLRDALAPWLDGAGVVHLVSDRYRSQYRNREDVLARFVSLVQEALRPRKTRRPTRIPRGVQEARLQAKKQRSATKHLRGRRHEDE